jgi:hypothetical protein
VRPETFGSAHPFRGALPLKMAVMMIPPPVI